AAAGGGHAVRKWRKGEGSRSWEAFSETAGSSAKPVLARQPVQHMMPQAVAGRQVGMLEVVGGIAMHPQALHQPQGVLVGRYGESYHLVQAKGIEGVAQRRLGRLVGEALRPM